MHDAGLGGEKIRFLCNMKAMRARWDVEVREKMLDRLSRLDKQISDLQQQTVRRDLAHARQMIQQELLLAKKSQMMHLKFLANQQTQRHRNDLSFLDCCSHKMETGDNSFRLHLDERFDLNNLRAFVQHIVKEQLGLCHERGVSTHRNVTTLDRYSGPRRVANHIDSHGRLRRALAREQYLEEDKHEYQQYCRARNEENVRRWEDSLEEGKKLRRVRKERRARHCTASPEQRNESVILQIEDPLAPKDISSPELGCILFNLSDVIDDKAIQVPPVDPKMQHLSPNQNLEFQNGPLQGYCEVEANSVSRRAYQQTSEEVKLPVGTQVVEASNLATVQSAPEGRQPTSSKDVEPTGFRDKVEAPPLLENGDSPAHEALTIESHNTSTPSTSDGCVELSVERMFRQNNTSIECKQNEDWTAPSSETSSKMCVSCITDSLNASNVSSTKRDQTTYKPRSLPGSQKQKVTSIQDLDPYSRKGRNKPASREFGTPPRLRNAAKALTDTPGSALITGSKTNINDAQNIKANTKHPRPTQYFTLDRRRKQQPPDPRVDEKATESKPLDSDDGDNQIKARGGDSRQRSKATHFLKNMKASLARSSHGFLKGPRMPKVSKKFSLISKKKEREKSADFGKIEGLEFHDSQGHDDSSSADESQDEDDSASATPVRVRRPF